MLGACRPAAAGRLRGARVGGDPSGHGRSRRARRRARRAHRGRLGDAREQRDRASCSRSPRSRRSFASGHRTRSLHTDAVQAAAWLDLGRAAAGADLVDDLRAQVRRAEGRRRARASRDGVELVPLVEGGGHEGGRARRHAERRGHRRARRRAARDPRRARGRSARASRVLRDRLEAGLARAVPGLVVNGDPTRRVAGHPHVALPRRRSRDAARRARSARRRRRVGFGVLVGRDRSVARARRDGHRSPEHARASVRFSLGYATTAADVDAALAVVPDAVAALVRCGRVSSESRDGDDERRGRLVGRGRGAPRRGPRRHRRDAEALGRRERLRVLQRRPTWRTHAASPRSSASRTTSSTSPTSSTRHVVAPYVDAYAAGETPNPCVECNRTMKFGALFERAEQLGFDELATGHHARVVDTPARTRRSRAASTPRRTSRTCSTCSARARSSARGCRSAR